jgi:hypothetical protein
MNRRRRGNHQLVYRRETCRPLASVLEANSQVMVYLNHPHRDHLEGVQNILGDIRRQDKSENFHLLGGVLLLKYQGILHLGVIDLGELGACITMYHGYN